MEKRTRKDLKWSAIAIAAILMFSTAFSGSIYPMLGIIPLFWIYVILDKFKQLTRKARLHKLYKKNEEL